jgi:hypothetical protein
MEDRIPAPPRWTIGAVSRATGLSPDTLRVWQKRYGFPVPRRKPSGHRLYSEADVRRLRRISQAIARGHRPGHVVRMSEPGLQSLLVSSGRAARGTGPQAPLRPLLSLVRSFDGGGLAAALLEDARALGPLEFVSRRVAPLVEEVGEAWARGAIGVHHEHFFSEKLEDVLRAVRQPFERGLSRPAVLLATLPGETHALGLQMAALVVAASGAAPVILGATLRCRTSSPRRARGGAPPSGSASRSRRAAPKRGTSSRRCGPPSRRASPSSSAGSARGAATRQAAA